MKLKKLDLIIENLKKASANYPEYHSDHEAYAVLKEEVDELWDAIRLKQSNPLRDDMIRDELIDIASVVHRYINLKFNSD